MDIFYNLLLVVLIILLICFLVIRERGKLLRLWKEVSAKEIVFHRLLSETIKLYYSQKDELRNEDNRLQFIRLGRNRRKKMRYLHIKERQELYLSLSDIFNEIEEQENHNFPELVKTFNKLQKSRRIYNSKVLEYNQRISVFPTRIIAIRMNLKIKEYFG